MTIKTQINRPKNSGPIKAGMGVYINKETGETQARLRGGKYWEKIGIVTQDGSIEQQIELALHER